MSDDLDFPGVAYISKTVSFDTPDIGTAGTVPVGKLPSGAIVYDTLVSVTTAFDAGSTNTLNVGTTDNSTRFVSTLPAAGSLPTGVWKGIRASGIGYNVPVGGVSAYVQYVQTGTAATTGAARVVIMYIPKG